MKNQNSQLQIFKNEEFGKVRCTIIEGKEYFVAKDIALALGYSNPQKAIRDHCKGVNETLLPTKGGKQSIKIIPEGDIYRLIIRSKLPSAEKFEKWVFDEILPTIRKTGGYISNSDLMVNTYFSTLDDTRKELVKGLFENIEAQQNKINLLNNENNALAQDIVKWADESVINAIIRKYGAKKGNKFGESWIEWKKNLLYRYSININSRITNYLNENNVKTKPKTLSMLRTKEELTMGLKTAISMCKDENIDISDILGKHLSNKDLDKIVGEVQ